MSKKSGKLKATYTKDGKELPLPGYTKILNIFHVAVDANIPDLGSVESEPKILKLYDFKERKEVPKEVPCLVQLHGAKVQLALFKEIHTKSKQSPCLNV